MIIYDLLLIANLFFNQLFPVFSQPNNGEFGYANYEVVYHHYMEKPGGDHTTVVKGTSEVIDYDKVLKNYTSVLQFNNIFSKYETHEAKSLSRLENLLGGAQVWLGHSYYNCLPQDLKIKEKVSKGGVDYIEDKYKIEWTITNEETSINGLRCIKAKGVLSTGPEWNTYYTAWFTPDIPVTFGPYDVNGLPGLIVKYKWNVIVTELYSISNIKEQKVILKLPKIKNIQDRIEVTQDNINRREEVLKNRREK